MGDAIPVVVTGAAGRMGRMLINAVVDDPGLSLHGAVEMSGHPEAGKDAGLAAGLGELGVKITDDFSKAISGAGGVIDFTAPGPTMDHLEECAEKGVPMVIGTTGLDEAQKARAAELSAGLPIVLAPNMSQGVNLLFFLVEQAARILGDGFDIEIVEAHHNKKKDAPSGTALRLGEVAAAGRGWSFNDTLRACREGMIGERPAKEIGIQTLRAGDIVGEHTVMFGGMGERIELTHRAHSRDTFARGAARAVHWLAGKGPGLYDMQDVLGLKGD